MTLILDVKDSHAFAFLEIINNLDYVHVVNEINDERKIAFIQDLAEAFGDVKLYEKGEKNLKQAKDVLNEL